MDYSLHHVNDNACHFILFIGKNETEVCLNRLEY
jgi:hypothetical protein